MKTISKIVSATALAAIIFVSCKKDDPAPAPLTPLLQLQAKWTFEKITEHDFFMGVSSRDTFPANPGEYLDFRTDNKVYSYVDAEYDTSSYSLLGTNKLILSDNVYNDTFNIQVLTNNQFQLYVRENDGTDYYEYTIFMKK